MKVRLKVDSFDRSNLSVSVSHKCQPQESLFLSSLVSQPDFRCLIVFSSPIPDMSLSHITRHWLESRWCDDDVFAVLMCLLFLEYMCVGGSRNSFPFPDKEKRCASLSMWLTVLSSISSEKEKGKLIITRWDEEKKKRGSKETRLDKERKRPRMTLTDRFFLSPSLSSKKNLSFSLSTCRNHKDRKEREDYVS